jgi:hypothetical protein
MIEGDWSGRVTGLRDQRVEIAMMRTPDGHGRIELSLSNAACGRRSPERPGERFGSLRAMFAVDDLDDTLAGSADTARSLSTKWSSTKTCIGSATSEVPRAFSSGWPSKSADAKKELGRHSRKLAQ